MIYRRKEKIGKSMGKTEKFLAVSVIFIISACQSGQVEYKYPRKVKGKYEMMTVQEAEQKNDTVFDKKYLTLDLNKPQKEKEEKPVKKQNEPAFEKQPLWKNVLPVLSRYPIAEIRQDSFIATEWFSDSEVSSKQLKINAVKVGENAQITVLRRQKDKNGEWVNRKNDEALADKIKNDIVNRSLNN